MVSCQLAKKISEWYTWDKNEKTLAAIQNLEKEGKFDELEKLLLKRLSFGTAGLRGNMGPGYNAMNDLVIIQTGQGLLKYLQSTCAASLLEKNGIVIGFDGRHNSRRWAELTATIFVTAGYKARLFGEMVPTPFVPFTVSKYSAAIGVMVTASHNPKEDNGYKVYAYNGAQIIPPADKEIQAHILENLPPLESSWNTSILENDPLLIDPLEEVLQSYLDNIKDNIIPEHVTANKNSRVTFTYTPMHGVGYRYIEKVFGVIGVKFVATPQQRDPDPEFPTVKFPNPEEGKSALNLSIKCANEHDSPVILANDPDADRMACAEIDPETKQWKIFNGNELGALLGWWMLECYKQKYPNKPLSDVYMISSTVSSMILRTMAAKEGFNFIDTLTGFKWMGNEAYKLLHEGKKVIFCFEEAIGFMCGSTVLDKDGVSAASHMATLCCHLYSQGKTLKSQLEKIYDTYGFHVSMNSYFYCYEKPKIDAIFNRIRNIDGPNTYPKCVLNGKYVIQNVRDLTTGYDNAQKDNKAIMPVDPSSHMITFNFDNGLVCTLRTSGTEPKIKYYTELCATPDQKDRNEIKLVLKEQVDAIIEEMFQPNINGLIPQSG